MLISILFGFLCGSLYSYSARQRHVTLLSLPEEVSFSFRRFVCSSFLRFTVVASVGSLLFYFRLLAAGPTGVAFLAGFIVTMTWFFWGEG